MENNSRREIAGITPISRISGSDIQMHGGKATNLARLHEIGVNVPRGFSVSCEVFTDAVSSNPKVKQIIKVINNSKDLNDILAHTSRLQRIVENMEIPKQTRSMILDTYADLQKSSELENPSFAVRSSATVEDRNDFSFAGQARSFLCVSNQVDVLKCIKGVWASAFTPQAVFYLRDNSVPLYKAKMATIIQEVIPAEVSGVMFTVNVVSKNTDQLVLNATWGLGETLVSGQIVPDMYVVGKENLEVMERRLGSKKRMSVPGISDSGGYTTVIETPQTKKEAHSLTDREIRNIAQVGLQIERCFGRAQDIEWCLKDSNLAVVQSRPITTF